MLTTYIVVTIVVFLAQMYVVSMMKGQIPSFALVVTRAILWPVWLLKILMTNWKNL